MKSQDHLSIYGIGPLYASISGGMTVVVCLLEYFRKLSHFSIPAVSVLLKIVGGICLLIAASLWLNALFVQRIAKCIVENKLVTTGGMPGCEILSIPLLCLLCGHFWSEQDYLIYCKNVNRCIPWIPKR